jgi:FkbM family methyltransferase
MLKEVKNHISLILREYFLRHYLVPYSRHGVPPAILQYITSKRPISVIDIGASRGDFTESLRQVYGLTKALLVEPQPSLCTSLRNRFKNSEIIVHECAVAESERIQEMEVLNWDYSSSLLDVRRDIENVNSLLDLEVYEKIQCQVRTLDNLMEEIEWTEPIDLLKLDVQGAELMALRGAEKTLHRTKMIFTEVSFCRLYEGAPVFQEVYDYLHDHGFKLLTISDGFRGADGDLLQGDALFYHDIELM